MGIDGLNPFITKKFGDVSRTRLIVDIGKAIAIDSNNWLYCPASDAMDRLVSTIDVITADIDRGLYLAHLKTSVVDFTKMWLEYGIVPVYVFDGKSPADKKQTKDKRQSRKQSLRDDIHALKTELQGQDRILVSGKKVVELKKLMKRDIWFSSEELGQIKQLIADIGIPIVQCIEEGEKLCSALAIHGVVDAVYSTDMDTMAYGAPMVVTSFRGRGLDERGVDMPTFRTIERVNVLKVLDLTSEEFLDFCIMCGCDYNNNMPNIAIGNSYKLIKSFRMIHNLPAKYDTECLRYERCRELLTIDNYENLIDNGRTTGCHRMYIERGRDILAKMNLHGYIGVFNKFHGC
jgi:flap endonuclease-1